MYQSLTSLIPNDGRVQHLVSKLDVFDSTIGRHLVFINTPPETFEECLVDLFTRTDSMILGRKKSLNRKLPQDHSFGGETPRKLALR